MNRAKIILILVGVLLFPATALSQTRQVHVEWEYQYDGNIAGFRLYHENQLACETTDPTATSLTCTVTLPDGPSQFTVTAFFIDGAESLPSPPISYIFSQALKAVFTASPLEGQSPLSVTFDASSTTGSIIGYDWMFGDGLSGTGSIISHAYTAPGNYTVTLKATDNLGATDLATVTVAVTDPLPNNTPPTAAISSSASVGAAPLDVQFDGSGSTDSDGSILSYGWDLGDGGTTNGVQTSHTYSTAGTFHATLTITDNGGLTDSASTPVLVTVPTDVVPNIPPVAVITASTSQGFSPLAVSFSAGDSSDPDGEVVSYSWSLGDGTTATGISVNHIYIQPAVYAVTLRTTDNSGASNQASYTVTVQTDTPEPSFAIEHGTATINNAWKRVNLAQQFVHPVVIVSPLSYNDVDPAVVRIRNVDPTGFDIRIQEWDYLDDIHADETVSYIAMEQGSYTLSNGTKVEADTFSAGNRFITRALSSGFQVAPVILTSVTSVNEMETVTGRVRKISARSFDFRLSEQESSRSGHADETIGYIAWEPGSGSIGQFKYEVGKTGDQVTDQWYQIDFQSQFTAPPSFATAMQSYDSAENSAVRYQYLTATNVLVFIEEEASKDSETVHTTETVGHLTLGAGTN